MNKYTALLLIFIFLGALCLSSLNFSQVAPEDTWTPRSPMQQERRGLGVAVVDGKIYAIRGGSSDSFAVNTNEAYDPKSDTWSYKAVMPTAR